MKPFGESEEFRQAVEDRARELKGRGDLQQLHKGALRRYAACIDRWRRSGPSESVEDILKESADAQPEREMSAEADSSWEAMVQAAVEHMALLVAMGDDDAHERALEFLR